MPTLIGKKRGMTQTWIGDGNRVPVTVIDLGPNVVTAIKTKDRDGYEALQLGFGSIRSKLVRKPLAGQFAKAGVEARRHLREVRGPIGDATVGAVLDCSVFSVGSYVDVIGTSKGKGFQGTIKLHHFSRGPEAHGSDNVRKPGSIGMHTHPGRVLKGKRMANKMGAERVTIKNLDVVAVDPQAHQMLVRGAVPGNNGSLVIVRLSTRQPKGNAS